MAEPGPDPPDVDDAETAMLAVAVAVSEVDEAWFAEWLRARVNFN